MINKLNIKKIETGGLSPDSAHLDIGKRIRLVRANRSRDVFGAALGVSRNTVLRYERGERCPDAAFLQRLCACFAVDPAWLLSGQGQMNNPPEVSDRSVGTFAEEFALVPLYSVEVSAGHGAIVDREQPVTRLAFRRDWLKEMNLQEDKVVTVLASGDSMADTIRSGAVLLVDTVQRQVVSDAIYILRQGGLLYVKRLQRLLDGSLRISSDNPAYAQEVVGKKDLPYLEIIGRVVWSGGRL
jgi:phage repressor protein C with HTH and peptisase S24 domain